MPERGPEATTSTRAPLRVCLLGRFEVVRGDSPIPASAWRRRRPADLLKIVALAPGRSMARDALVDVLWPDKDPGSGANNLHRALYDLRQILGDRYVDIERGRLRLDPSVWVDVDAFEAAVQTGGPERRSLAVSLYRGDLCPDDRGAAWLAPRRALLRARFSEVAHPLARAAAERGDPSAITLLRRILSADPASEEAHRLLVKLLAESGRRAEALRQCDACEVALRAAGAGSPSEEMRALRLAVQHGDLGPAEGIPALDGARRAARRLLGVADPGPVRGRGAVLLLVESLLEAGHGMLVFLGEHGVGKTRLAVEGARLARAHGASVMCGVAGAGPEGVPHAVFADAFAAERRSRPEAPDPFGALALSPGSVAADQVRRRVFEAVEAALREVAAGKVLYLVLDDLHLADESSLDLLHLLARHARELRLVIVATCSEQAVRAGTPIQAALAHLDGAKLARGVRISRLQLAGVRDLLADLRGEQAPEPLARDVYRATDGSPLLVEELVRAQRESSSQEVPADPAAALRARADRLGAEAGALLDAASVAGRRFEFDLVRPVCGLSSQAALAALEKCLAAQVLDEDGAGYRFHHALVREAIYGSLPASRRAALHAAVAEALEAAADRGSEPPSEALAHHRLRAGQPERALRHLVAAGHRAEARAGLREALSFFGEALRLLEAPETLVVPEDARPEASRGANHREVLEAMGRIQLALGELGGAVRSFTEAARLDDGDGFAPAPEHRARAFRLAAVAHAAGGDLRAAASDIEEGLAAASGGTGEEAPALLFLRGHLEWHEGRVAEARESADAARIRAEAQGDTDLAAHARDLAAIASTPLGLSPPGPNDASTVRVGDGGLDGNALEVDLDLLAWECDLLGDRTAAELGKAASAYTDRARARGFQEAFGTGRHGEAVAALALGDLDVAEAELVEALRAHRGAGSSLGEALALERLATLRTMRGRLDDGAALVDEGVVAAERGVLRQHARTRLLTTLARNRLAASAPYAAEDALREASASAARHGPCATCDAALRSTAVRIFVARGRLADAQAEAAQLGEIARRKGGRVLGAVARLARARVLAAEGRVADALAALEAARAGFVAAGLRYDAAVCARIETRLCGPAAPLAEELATLDRMVVVDEEA